MENYPNLICFSAFHNDVAGQLVHPILEHWVMSSSLSGGSIIYEP